jgi:hypothetical protein
MNKKIKKIGIVVIVGIILLVTVNTNIVSAADDYIAVSGISEIEEAANTADLKGMVGIFFSYTIGVAVILAIIFIIYGSVLYMTTDAFSEKSEGKEKIISAIGGLILALISWLILHEINPELVSGNTTIPKIYEALFTSNGEGVILRYLDNSGFIDTFIGNINRDDEEEEEIVVEEIVDEAEQNEEIDIPEEDKVYELVGTFLPKKITTITKSPNEDSFFYLITGNNGSTGYGRHQWTVLLYLNLMPHNG